MRKVIPILCLVLAFSHGAFASITITSSQMQVEAKGMLNPSLLITGNTAWNFSSQNYLGINSVDEISVTLTLFDGDTGMGEFDAGELMLELDNLNTGLALDGFAHNATMANYTVSGANHAVGLLSLLRQDGLLLGRVLDLSPNDNYIKIRGGYMATLSLTDHELIVVPQSGDSVSVVPVPSAVLLSSFGVVATGWLKRKRQLAFRG
jgi:hypothetical protein